MEGPFGAPLQKRDNPINITPLIDVMFLLLIFFMVSATFREHMGIDITLPDSQTATDQVMDETYEIAVDGAGAFYFEGRPVSQDGLRTSLSELAAKGNPDIRLLLSADKEARFVDYIAAIDIARETVGGKLIILTRPNPPARHQ